MRRTIGPFRTDQFDLSNRSAPGLTGTCAAAGWIEAALLHLIPAPHCRALKYQDDGMMNLVAASVSETFPIVGTCINCTAPASLLATMTVIAIGVALAVRSERRASRSRNA